jgi:hypothetical protein
MNVKEILALIPEEKLQALAVETKVNVNTKKLFLSFCYTA